MFFSSFLRIFTKNLSFRSENCYSHQNELNRAKLRFSDVLKYFAEINKKTSLLGQKSVFLIKMSQVQLN